MKKRATKLKRGFAFFITLMMCLSLVQTTAFAEGEEPAQGFIESTDDKSADSEDSSPADDNQAANENTAPDNSLASGGTANVMPADRSGDTSAENSAAVTEFMNAVESLKSIADADIAGKEAAVKAVEDLYGKLTPEEQMLPQVQAAYQEVLLQKQAAGDTYYVKAGGSETATGLTEDDPFPSLAAAVKKANESSKQYITINLLSDAEAVECARINGKDVTIKGNGYTITRGEAFAMISDNARSWYNPAMIEVCDSSNSKTAFLRLENITLDDACKTAGTRYSQAAANGTGGNGDTVQDGIIATYDGVGTIILGNGVTLNGYGGMSAVRLSGGTLIMETGSTITGGKTFTSKGGGNGAAGAVWIQGGLFTMNAGAAISGVSGRGIYLDGGGSKAVINGTIADITANSMMWQGTAGVAMHVRNKSDVTLGTSGRIINIKGSSGGESALYVNSSNFKSEPGSLISGTNKIQAAYIEWAGLDNDPYNIYLNGTVENCSYTDVLFRAFCARYTIGPEGEIKNTTATSLFSKIGVFYLLNAGQVDVRGKIMDNNNKGIYMANQTGGDTYVWVRDGGYIHKNSSYGIYANNGGHVIMEGGEISENSSYGIYVRSKDSYPRGTLDMTGGKIINNKSTGVYYETCGKNADSHVDITGGEISGNRGDQLKVTGYNATDAISRIYVKKNLVKPDVLINTPFGKLTLDTDYADIYVGGAKAAASDQLKNLAASYKSSSDDTNEYQIKGSAFWFKPTEDSFHFTTLQSSQINRAIPLYVAYIPLKADGTPEDDAKLTVVPVENVPTVDIALSGLKAGQPYALMWMQPKEKFGTLTITADKDDITEVLGQNDYALTYTAEYTLAKDIASASREFTALVKIDDRLSYREGTLSLTDDSNEIYELIGEPEMDVNHNLIIRFGIKDDASAQGKEKAKLTFQTEASFADFPDGMLETDGIVTGIAKLNEGKDTPFIVNTPAPCKTTLTPLPTYVITYTGGSVRVKEGTELRLNLSGGNIGDSTLPDVITSDLTLPDPFRIGYNFNGWSYVLRKDVNGKVYVLFSAGWTAPGQPPVTPVTPVTPGVPAPAVVAVPAAPAALVPAAIPAALQPVEEPETPLADISLTDDGEMVKAEDPEIPLASGAVWALLNLLLMIVTVGTGLLFSMSAMLRRKQEDEMENDEEERTSSKAMRMISIIPAVISAVIFFLTEDITAKMTLTDHMTVIMLLITVAQIILIAFLAQRSDRREKEFTERDPRS